jgi:hypothetical protein
VRAAHEEGSTRLALRRSPLAPRTPASTSAGSRASAPNSTGEGFKTAKRERNQLGNPSRRRHPLQRLMVLYAADFGCMAPKSICSVGICFFCEKDTPRRGLHASKVVAFHVQNLNRNRPIILVPLSMALRFLGEIDDVLTTSAA